MRCTRPALPATFFHPPTATAVRDTQHVDRILVAPCQIEKRPILTREPQIAGHNILPPHGSHCGRCPGVAICCCAPRATSNTHTVIVISGPLSGKR